jgi:hypothetical protein
MIVGVTSSRKASSNILTIRGQGTTRLLRFSKSGNPDVEEAYATHYVWNQSQEKKRHVIAQCMLTATRPPREGRHV